MGDVHLRCEEGHRWPYGESIVDAGGHHCPRCMRPALRVEADEPPAYSPTDPSTWTRAQLLAELEARMGLRAPEGWEWRGACWGKVTADGFTLEVGRSAGGSLERVDCVVTDPNGFSRYVSANTWRGAFALAERAAGMTSGGGE